MNDDKEDIYKVDDEEDNYQFDNEEEKNHYDEKEETTETKTEVEVTNEDTRYYDDDDEEIKDGYSADNMYSFNNDMNNSDDDDIYKVEDDEYDYDDDNDDKKSDLKSKLIKYGIWFVVGFLVLILLLAILSPKGSSKKQSSENSITLTSGEKYTLNYSKGTYNWKSSNQSVAKVTDDGEIEGLKEGDAIITITTGNETISYKVHVNKIDDSVVVTNVKMEKNTIELEKGKSYEMSVTITPSNVSNPSLTWSSSDESVATVSDGVIKAVSAGTCMITVKTTNGYTDNCLVRVVGSGDYNPIEDIDIETKDITLNKGTSFALTYKVTPSESSNLITWKSSDNEVASVENGVIYALKGGSTKITAKSGDIEKSVDVTVVGEEYHTKFVLNQSKINLKEGESYTLVPSDKNLKLTWASSDSSIASVDGNGNVVARREGNVSITAKTDDGGIADCVVIVSRKREEPSKEKVSLNVNSVAINVGESVKLIETITPANNVAGVTWNSSNTSVATVSNGEVYGVSDGTATITVRIPNGSTAECAVTVSTKVVRVQQVVLNASSINLSVNGSTQLIATIKPSNATNKDITWSSNNSSVAVVDSNGRVTAKAKGSTKIYAKTANGVYDDCTVIVK